MAKKTYTEKELKALYKKKLAFIDKSLGSFDNDLKRLETELFDLLLTEYATQFTVTNGVIVLDEHNLAVMNSLNKTMQRFKETFATDTFKKLGENMIKMTDLTSDYFRAMTGGDRVIAQIQKKLSNYRAAVGIDKKGEVIRGSFLDNLAETPELKNKLSKYMQQAVTSEMNYKDFSSGLKEIVKGSPGVNSSMERYVKTYAHDTFFNQARQQDNFFADQLQLDCFIYEGEAIETTRPFCRKRHGKLFSRKQGKSWNKLEWEGKIPDVDFFNQVGGYNCRHVIRWVPCPEKMIENIVAD